MTMAILQAPGRLAVPAVLVAAGFVLVYYSAELPPSLSGLTLYGPYIVGALGAALAVAFRRGRALLAIALLCLTFGAQQAFFQGPMTEAARTVYAAMTLLVPLNLAALALLPERGIFNRSGASRASAIALQVALVAALAASSEPWLAELAARDLTGGLRFGRIPPAGLIALAVGLMASLIATVLTRSAVSAALTGAIVAFAVAAHVPSAWLSFSVFTVMGELMVAVAVLQDTFRMAFRDELTGIPSRRALNEQLAGLGPRYTVAMIDVDHFKKFNDTYGHEVGDQVLKMVASHIVNVGGGGKGYRYGGEEFTVLFPGKEIGDALPYLEDLRRDIERYRLALRSSERPKKAKGAQRERGGWRGRKAVSVTVSIGVAERNERLTRPQAVIEAADRALYRAKEKGRNRVSR